MDHSGPHLDTTCSPSQSKNGSPEHKKARGRVRGLPRLLAINSLVCGVEIVSSAAFTYIPPLLLKAGYTETVMTIILGIAPFLDMMTVPLLAEWSDRCTSVLGRRRPFIMFLSTVLLVSLILIPYGPTITTIITGTNSSKINMIILAVGVILLDYSYQALFNPCESLLSDLMATAPDWEQTRGFTVYSAGISLGCILGYLIVSIDWSSSGFLIGSQEQTAFSVIFILFLPCLFLTLFCAKEKPYRRTINLSMQPAEGENHLGKDAASEKDLLIVRKSDTEVVMQDRMTVLDLTSDVTIAKDHPSDGGYESGSSESEETAPLILPSSEMLKWRLFCDYKLTNSDDLPQILKLPLDTWKRVTNAPTVLRRLFLSELFGWMGFMCHNMFFTDFVGQYMYGGLPDAPEHTKLAILYDEGVRMGSWGLFLHSLTACLYAFCIQQHIVRLVGHRTVFIGGLFIFTITMAATIISPTVTFLNVVTALSGIGFAALTSTPNMLVTLYNTDRQLYLWDDSNQDGSEERGLGTDVAVLDTAYFLSQIVLSVCMGPLVDLTGSSLPYMIVATLTGMVSVYCSSRVVFTDRHLKQLRAGAF
ncbi:Membrane-associated transporter protein-like 1 [Homarus americanus]|uniref:Membrane-associated transporter protein-like 1 n=1 Tax=Homarus americanus TaxID=6706 RepID=A0A8J5N4S7_HOMAM|nr:Membrane-associated transporter protein-like 1 [Homarus americanus]